MNLKIVETLNKGLPTQVGNILSTGADDFSLPDRLKGK
jgi:hypothetical protein